MKSHNFLFNEILLFLKSNNLTTKARSVEVKLRKHISVRWLDTIDEFKKIFVLRGR